MDRRRFRQILVAAALLAAPAALQAQQAQPAAEPTQEQVKGWLAEMQQLHGRLEALQQQALQDPQLGAAQEALGASIKSTMEQVDPQLQQKLERLPELEAQAAAAQQAGDQAKLQQLGAEAQQIQMAFMAAQQKALQQPALAEQVQSFQTRLEAKMLEIDPAAAQVIARFRELEGKVAEAMQGAQG